MKTRTLASLALGAAVILGTTGCNMIAPQATTIEYSASDGVNVPESGPLKVRNALVVADETGTTGNLVAAIVNDTDSAENLSVGVAGGVQTVSVPARSVVSVGMDGQEPLPIENLGAKPGEDIEISFQSGTGTGVAVHIPVLDGTLDQYAEFVPSE